MTNYQKEKLRKQSRLWLLQKEQDLQINLTKEVKDLYAENYDIDERNWKHK